MKLKLSTWFWPKAINPHKTNRQLPLLQATESTNQTQSQLEMKSSLTLLPKSFILIKHSLEPLTAMNVKAHVPAQVFQPGFLWLTFIGMRVQKLKELLGSSHPCFPSVYTETLSWGKKSFLCHASWPKVTMEMWQDWMWWFSPGCLRW